MKKMSLSLSPFVRAWNALFDISLPAFLSESDEHAEDTPTALCFPVAGAIVGIVILLSCWILSIIPGDPAGPFICAVLVTLGLEFITGFRSISALVSFLELKMKGVSATESITLLSSDISAVRTPQSLLVLVSIFLIRLFCFGAFISEGLTSWIVCTFILNLSVQAFLTDSPNSRTGEPMFDHDSGFEKKLWLITAGIVIVLGGSLFLPNMLALGLIMFSAYKFRAFCLDRLDGVTGTLIGFAGYCAEFIALVIGLTFLFR